MGARERAQGWALSYILLPYPSSLSLTLGRPSLMPFVSLSLGTSIVSQVLHQHLCVVVQYLFKSLTVFDVTNQSILRVDINYPLRVCGLLISLWSVINLLTQSLKVYV